MFCSRRSNSLVNNFHERVLTIVYDDHNNSCSELLMTKNEHTIYQQNINVLMKKIISLKTIYFLPLSNDMFYVRKINYNLRKKPKQKLSRNGSRDNILLPYCAP